MADSANQFLLYAHRGDNRNFTENTLKAFQSSIRAGYRAMELDLVRLKDGNVVVFHDDDLKRICGVDRSVYDVSLKEFKKYFPELLSFKDLIANFRTKNIEINLEIKDDPETLRIISKDIEKLKNPLISSFNPAVVDEAAVRGLKCAYLFNGYIPFYKRKSRLLHKRVHLPARMILKNPFAGMIFRNYEIYCYTVNDRDELQKLSHYPFVRGVFTDRIDMISEVSKDS